MAPPHDIAFFSPVSSLTVTPTIGSACVSIECSGGGASPPSAGVSSTFEGSSGGKVFAQAVKAAARRKRWVRRMAPETVSPPGVAEAAFPCPGRNRINGTRNFRSGHFGAPVLDRAERGLCPP